MARLAPSGVSKFSAQKAWLAASGCPDAEAPATSCGRNFHHATEAPASPATKGVQPYSMFLRFTSVSSSSGLLRQPFLHCRQITPGRAAFCVRPEGAAQIVMVVHHQVHADGFLKRLAQAA